MSEEQPLALRYYASELRHLLESEKELLEKMKLIASLHSHEASVVDCAMALYEASCIANAAIAKATGGKK